MLELEEKILLRYFAEEKPKNNKKFF